MIDCHQNAEKIAKAVTFQYGESNGPLILDMSDAMENNSFFPEPKSSITTGDVKGLYNSWHVILWIYHSFILAALAKSDMHIQGQIECGTQYHFTMETQTALVVPGEGDTYAVYSCTQWTGFVQAAVSNILGIPSSRYVVGIPSSRHVVHHKLHFGVGANELKWGGGEASCKWAI